jgi:hypothetical protein
MPVAPYFVNISLQLDKRVDGEPNAQGPTVEIVGRSNFTVAGVGDTPAAAFQAALQNGGLEWLEKNVGLALGGVLPFPTRPH